MSFTSIVVKIAFKKDDAKRDKGLITPLNIKRHDNLDYAGDKDVEHLLDVYYLKDTEKPLPVIISVHGGGWVYGDKEAYQFYCMGLAQKGFTVINFNYRLAPKSKFPKALEDINTVFHWLKNNSEKFYLDLNNLFVVGDSAGAQIACQYTTILTNSEYAKRFQLQIPDMKIKAIGLNCGLFDPIDRLNTKGNRLMKSFFKNLLRDYLGKDIYRYQREMDFQSNLTPSFPPAFITCSVNDRVVGCKPVILGKLKDASITHIYKEYGHEDKSNNHVFHLDIRKDEATKLNNEQIEFFRKNIVK